MIPETWNKATIGELCQMVKGKAPIMKTKPGEYPLVTMGEEHKTADKYELDTEAVCVPMISSFGHGKPGLKRVHYIKGKFALSNILTALIIKEPNKLSTKYLALYLQTFKDQLIVPLQTGAANMSLRPDKLAGVPVYFPSFEHQTRIVQITDSVESMRKLGLKTYQRTQDLIPSIFYEMFGSPRKTKGDFPTVKIGEITSLVTSGLTPKGGARIYTKTGPLFIRSQNVLMNRLDFTDIACLPQKIHDEMSRTKVRQGDVLLNITGASIGRVAWVEKMTSEANVNQHVCIIRLKENRAIPEYVSVVLSTPYGQSQIMSMQAGASRQGLNHQQVRNIEIPLPSPQEQRAFAERISEVHQIEAKQEQCNANIENLYTSILARAFEGTL